MSAHWRVIELNPAAPGMNYPLLGFLAGIALAFAGCGQPPVPQVAFQRRLPPHPNPTNYEFEASITDVKAAVQKACGDEWRKDLAGKSRGIVWKGGGDPQSRRFLTKALQQPEPRLFWKGDADALAKGLLTKPGNEDDAYVYNADAAFESQVYFKDGQPLFYQADFHLHLTALGPRKTRVEIFTYDPCVGTGVDERWSPHGPRLVRVVVEPSTLEEYQILLRIGEQLQTTNMPPLVTPGPDSSIQQLTKPRQS
jgi:hypothetical protein